MSQTVNITPTWRSILPLLLELHAHGTLEGRKQALAELQRMAGIADDAASKAQRELQDG